MQITVEHLSLILHLCIELPGSINFMLRPSSTLSKPQPQSHGVIRQYALLLMSTNIMVMLLLIKPMDELTQQISGALALYHTAPIIRAVSRIRSQEAGRALGGPWLHALVHSVCAAILAHTFLSTTSL